MRFNLYENKFGGRCITLLRYTIYRHQHISFRIISSRIALGNMVMNDNK
jgi:hypothetical protein